MIKEWPRDCMYWDDKDLDICFTKYGFSLTTFDGCMYGLRAAFGKNKGMHIKKPWKIATINTCLPQLLNKTCDGSHSHTPCEGKNTMYTQGYTREIVAIIHKAINLDIQKLGLRVDEKNKRNNVCCAVDLLQHCDVSAIGSDALGSPRSSIGCSNPSCYPAAACPQRSARIASCALPAPSSTSTACWLAV